MMDLECLLTIDKFENAVGLFDLSRRKRMHLIDILLIKDMLIYFLDILANTIYFHFYFLWGIAVQLLRRKSFIFTLIFIIILKIMSIFLLVTWRERKV